MVPLIKLATATRQPFVSIELTLMLKHGLGARDCLGLLNKCGSSGPARHCGGLTATAQGKTRLVASK
jgi:hypothetical protein